MSGTWTNWDAITEYLKLLAAKGAYASYVQPLLDLIPRFQGRPEFDGIQPGLAHLTLTLGLMGSKRKIHIDLEQPGYYNIYLDHCTSNMFGTEVFYGERVTVPASDVMPALFGYIGRLREESLLSVA